MARVFERRHDEFGIDAEFLGRAFRKTLGVVNPGLARILDLRDQIGVLPDRDAVLAPIETERPARQAFARIPFALAVMQQPAGREARPQASDEIVGERALGRPYRGNIPFRRFEVIDGNESRLAAHGQAYVAGFQIGIDLFAEPVETGPGIVGEWPGDPRRLADALDAHLEVEFDVGKAGAAADRRRRAVMRRGRDRDMAFAGQHARGDIESDPARAGKIDFGPGVQIGEIGLDLARAFDRIDVGPQLNEIAGHETGGETEMPQDLDQQPCRVAARSGTRLQRPLGGLDARLHANDVPNLLLQLRVEIDQKTDRARRLARNPGEVGGKQRTGLRGRKIGRELGLEIVGIGERKTVGIGFDKKIERIDHGHLRREIDFDPELGGLFRKDEPREPVALRILLPVHEMIGGRDLERIAQDRRARVRRRSQANGLRAEIDRAIVFVVRDVMQCDEDRHRQATPAAFLSKTPLPMWIKP